MKKSIIAVLCIALSTVACTGQSEQAKLSTNPLVVKNHSFTMAHLTSGQLQNIQPGENVVDLIKKSKIMYSSIGLTFSCDNGNTYYQFVDIIVPNLIKDNITTNSGLESYMTQQLSQNKLWTGNAFVSNDRIGFTIYWIDNSKTTPIRVNCWMTRFPQGDDIVKLLSLTQEQGATKL